jgi:hypothetical protein
VKRLSIALLLALVVVGGLSGVRRLESSNRTASSRHAAAARHGAGLGSVIPRPGEVPGQEADGEGTGGAESPEGRSDYLDARTRPGGG